MSEDRGNSIDSALFEENERLGAQPQSRNYASIGQLDLKAGGTLEEVVIAYEAWGKLNSDCSNAILVCHALSGDSHAVGWWDRLVGPGKAIDTNQYFVVCSNVLGGCQGSTGPSSVDQTGKIYGSDFPVILIEDMVEAQFRLMNHLGVPGWNLVAGGSMGGMQALGWATSKPEHVKKVWATASCAAHSAMQIGFNESGRQAILRDPNFKGGNYYGCDAPIHGLAVARMIGHLTFLSEQSFASKFGRNLQDKDQFEFNGEIEFAIESYLNYQGDKFTKRFDANSHLVLTRAIDYFEVADLSNTKCEFLFTSFNSDWIYPSHQSKTLHTMAQSAGRPSHYVEIDSPWGHDAFLLEDQVQAHLVREFL